ncbi:uncharacterized protein C7orf57 homolog [Trichomycterus rosablanca]|uniref:uncharacterized protein C7orf57 homolog n=1 Tax=Trichomycterus rosablanca TaxID=2290929 RepID=UPI002F35E044
MSAEPNYRRSKPGMRATVPNSNGAAGPTSQIPGLSQSADDATPMEKGKGRRVGIQACDSDYVKLAKQGGHKGLLSHDNEDGDSKSGGSQKASDWFSGENNQSQSKASSQRLVAPFGTDECTAWDDKILGVDNATSKMENLAMSPEEIEEANKYKRMSHVKKTSAPVSMSKLLSFGYMEDEKKSADDDASSVTSEQTSPTVTEEDQE